MRTKSQKKALWYLILGLGICAGISLVNRFIIDIPNWIAIVLIVVALLLVFMGFFNLFQRK